MNWNIAIAGVLYLAGMLLLPRYTKTAVLAIVIAGAMIAQSSG